ncbi:MAG: proline--tRNA ligase [Halobacteriovoraceae bacterium]|nr:proline--tRNA ligase [Halobacteriovoraceae bacterium]
MRLSQSFWQTFKEVPKEAEIPSHQLMLKAGLIQKSGAGLYQYLPFAVKVLHKIESIIREELDKIGSQEVIMSVVTPGELWRETGRWDEMGSLMLQFNDRGGKELCISPTNEEAITDIFRTFVKSYKQLPVSLYQINTKFRDEIRPRFGLMRAREFSMKDAYTFHLDKACLDRGYQDMYNAYAQIFDRIGFDYMIVEADAGAMADSSCQTHEFQVLAEVGEDFIVYCKETGYASNIEKAKTLRKNLEFAASTKIEEVATPNKSTIADVCELLKVPQYQSLKSLVYTAINGEEEKHYLVMLLGDDELNELKLKNYLNCDHLIMAKEAQLSQLGLQKGFIGPYQLESKNLEVLFDSSIDENAGYIVGANKKDTHLKGFTLSRDFNGAKKVDLRLAQSGDYEASGKYQVEIKKGIEVGHVFQLGDKYTQSMKAMIVDQNGKQSAPLMGCYGIGVSRVMAAAIEQCHDENGIIWPAAIAPYHVYFAVIAKSEETKKLAEDIYRDLLEKNLEVVWDDRGLGPGFMFKDADLLGLPLRLTLGERDYQKEGTLEIKVRKAGAIHKVKKEEVADKIQELLKELM